VNFKSLVFLSCQPKVYLTFFTMRKIFSLLFKAAFVLLSHCAQAQNVGIGTTTPHNSARLDVSSSNGGFLPPRITGQQRNAIVNPAAGLIIFCTDCGEGEMQYYNGSSWRSMNMGAGLNPTQVTGITAHTCGGAPNVHNATIPYGTMTDQQGNIYRTVQIGMQTWMVENLRTTVYRNNAPINPVADNTMWANNTTGAYCSFNNSTNNDCPYGKLYNWYAVNNTNQLCPTGWHVPTDAEWTVLTTFLGSESVAGGKMKSTGTLYWNTPNTGATNSFGLSGLPGGLRYFDGSFYDVGNSGYWWSSTESTTYDAWFRFLCFYYGDVLRDSNGKSYGFSVRCLRD
jgi:uncharacterized protein (TIGR02145 family)